MRLARAQRFIPLALGLFLGACAASPAREQSGPSAYASRGHAVAVRLCSSCHAVEIGAASPVPAAPAFNSLEMRHTASLPGRLVNLTRDGHYGMPPLRLSEEDARALVAYIAGLDNR